MMDSPSFCYKFYWLDAITTLITENCTQTTFNDIIDEMIADAWYSVIEFHIHLSGIVYKDKDNLEKAVTLLQEHADLPSNASKTQIKNAIKTYEVFIHKEKKTLTNMVPYKALSGFFINHDMGPLDDSVIRMVEKIRNFHSQDAKLPYTLGNSSGLDREVYFDEDWMKMIQDNAVAIKGWIKHEKVKWLQRNNPEIPGIVYKLAPLDNKARKLVAVRNLWKGIFPYVHIDDVYTQKPIDPDNYEVDHFVPFSFVMNDELWNLLPMDSSLNSGKNNNLPVWDEFFGRFASNQFIMYELIHSKKDIFALYEKCYKDNLHSVWAAQELYRKGNKRDEFINILSKNMRPVYDSASRQGYSVWKFRG
ncbi:MAG: HNH endonuclease [Clostridiales bacterium]|nr:HNH endonuclease [Clostridiales bacterium]